MEESVVKIIDGLIKKSQEKKAKWLESSTKGEYKILFNGATVSIGFFTNSYGKAYYVMKIFNGEGKVVIKETMFLTNPSVSKLRELFTCAQESCLKKRDTIDSILMQLSNDTVGNVEAVDLPF